MKKKTQMHMMSENDVAEYVRKAFGYGMQTSGKEGDVDDGQPTGTTGRQIQRVHQSEEQEKT